MDPNPKEPQDSVDARDHSDSPNECPDPTQYERMASQDDDREVGPTPEQTPDATAEGATGAESRPSSGLPTGPAAERPAPDDLAVDDFDFVDLDFADLDSDESGGLTSEEEVLRRLLQNSVQGLEGSPRALEHLRRAVPARRAHRRQALVGAAASMLLAVTAVPALIHTANTSSSSAASPLGNTASHESRGGTGGASAGPSAKPQDKPHGADSSKGTDEGSGGKDKGSKGAPSGGASAGPSQTPDVQATHDANSSACTAGQFTNGSPEIGAPDGEGKVYGTFTVSNSSTESCSVSGPGSLSAAAQSGADPSRVSQAQHTAGDPATELPATAAQEFVLEPGQSFQVKFGWVPASGGNGCDTGPPSTTDSGGGTSGTTEGDSGTGSTPAAEPDPPQAGSVTVTYAPEGGGAASATVQNVCAGTVYYTPPIAPAA
jgi:hypothetical protein